MTTKFCADVDNVRRPDVLALAQRLQIENPQWSAVTCVAVAKHTLCTAKAVEPKEATK